MFIFHSESLRIIVSIIIFILDLQWYSSYIVEKNSARLSMLFEVK